MLCSLHLHLYHTSSCQELKLPDYKKWLYFCRWFQNFTHGGMRILDTTFFTGEVRVHLDRCVNVQKFRLWSKDKPHVFVEFGLHTQKQEVRGVVSGNCVISPLFFHETIMVVWYQLTVQDFIAFLEINERYAWFRKDGAPAHTMGSILNMLQEFFGSKKLSFDAECFFFAGHG